MQKKISIVLIVAILMTILGACNNSQPENHLRAIDGKEYDVIVVGGEPEGVSAAVSAARNGMRTLIINKDEDFGGLMTLGELNFIDMCEGRDGTLLTQGIFKEFYDKVDGSAFDIQKAKEVFLQMLYKEDNIAIATNTKVKNAIVENGKIVGVNCIKDNQNVSYYAKCVIDATADADVAALAGVPYTIGGEDIGDKDKQMGVTLVFELANVKWREVFWHLNTERVKTKYINKQYADMGATTKMAWGYTDEGYAYVPNDELMRLRGFNIAKQDNGNVLINALIIFGIDVLDEDSKADGIKRAKAEMQYLVPYINTNFKGFENATLVDTAEQLYVRESRHIISEYQLTLDDVLENRDQWDKIAIGSYPLDVQATINQTYGTVIGNPDRYAISYRSIVPKDIDNLLVVGRSSGYTSMAAASARVIPLGMACAEGAGVCASYSVNNNVSTHDMCNNKEAIDWVQGTLKAQGAYLDDFTIIEEVTKHWAYENVKILRNMGLLDGGYSNDYHLDEEMDKGQYQSIINAILAKHNLNDYYVEVSEVNAKEVVNTLVGALKWAKGEKSEDDFSFNKQWLIDNNIISAEILDAFRDENNVLTTAQAITLCANVENVLK